MRLSTKLAGLFLLLSIVPMATVGYLAFNNGQQTIEKDAFTRLTVTTILKEDEFERWVQNNEQMLRALARRPFFRESAVVLVSYDGVAPESGEYRSLHEDHLRPTLEEERGFLDLSLLRVSDGLIIVSTTNSLEGTYRESEPFFLEGQRDTYVGNIEYALHFQEITMHISTPVLDEDGAVVAVLSGRADLSEISSIMAQGSGLSESGETYLVNSFNFMVTESRFDPEAALRRAVYSEGVTDCLAHNNDVGFYEDYRGMPVIGSYRWMPERELCILTEIDQAEAYAPVHDLRNTVFRISFVVGLAVIALGVFFARTITGPVHQLVKGVEEVRRGNLEYRIALGGRDEISYLADAFDKMTAARKQAQETLAQHADELAWSNTKLEASNKELEAFTYSVSHDLRAPLRAMVGFSRILVEEHAPQLSDDAQRYLDLVALGAQQMGLLIDGLLAFSRLGRQALKKQSVAPADLVHQVIEELHDEQVGREVEIIISDLPSCYADPTLLRQVFANLVGNALKFTSKRDKAIIEVGYRDEDGKDIVYFIKDNGVGFDMQYADKLFGVFQRLHRTKDFEGTGIGLATVQRIISRHGGRVWAEAEVDQGATFFFTLRGKTSDD
jgi:signal transduction histidine kinase